MGSVSGHRRKRKIRRSGRHATPPAAEKVAQKAGKAAPALAVVGVLAAAPQVHKLAQPEPVAASEQMVNAHLDAAVLPAQLTGRTHTVQSGDTLSAIAMRFYGQADDWGWLYEANRPRIDDPGLIYPGQVLNVPHDPPASFTAKGTDAVRDHDEQGGASQPKPSQGSLARADYSQVTALSGTLGCSGLEELWQSAGGSPSAAVTAASIAMAESGGNQYATGSVGERGYWQINPVNGTLSTYDAYGNAQAAIILSHNGIDWSPWTTYVSGTYSERC